MPLRRGAGCSGRLLIGVVIAVIAIAGYFFGTRQEYNPVTQENQRIALTVQEEIALGLRAAPEMAQQYGGLSQDPQLTNLVDTVGQRLVEQTEAAKSPYQFDFHLLADTETVNAFALPGGQIFMTTGLLQLLETEGQVAGVLGHEMGHVLARHSAEQIAKSQLTQGLAGAASAVLYDPNNPDSAAAAQLAALVGQLVNMKYSRSDELESDRLGVRFLAEAGYDPRAMIQVMGALERAANGQNPPEFFSTHPNPENRIRQIEEAIAQEFPDGVPEGLQARHGLPAWKLRASRQVDTHDLGQGSNSTLPLVWRSSI
jgi:predicted Zn-dependent protease